MRSDAEIRERPAGQRHRPQHVQRRAQPVAGEQIVRKDDVARLLAAERQPAIEHLLHHVLVADRRAHQLDARAACSASSSPMLLITVATIALALQPPFGLQLPAAHQQHGVAVDDLPAVIDEDRAIAVAVERHAHLAAALDHRPRQQLGMRRPALQVDVAAVGLIADHLDVEAHAAEQRRRHRRRRAVRAVDGQLESGQRLRFRNDRPKMIEVGADQIGVRDVRRLASPARVHDASARIASTSRSTRSVNFSPLPGEDLDAVVFERIVRGRDHDAGVVAVRARQIRDGRRRHDADARHRRALARRAVRELALRSTRPTRACRGRRGISAALQPDPCVRPAAGRARAPRRAGGPSPDRAGNARPCRARRRCRTAGESAVGWRAFRPPVVSMFATGNAHLH